jgi:carbonic anhydrase
MDRRQFLTSLLACPVCAATASAADGPHWEYEGAHGAAKWGEMDSKFKACAVGAEQSPIDLSAAIRATGDPISINWKPEAYEIVNNGHTIQANSRDGGTLAIGKRKYELKQFHFHTPSEHAIDGNRTSMEVHFVHATPEGRLGVVGVLMVGGGKHSGFSTIMANAPKKEGSAMLKEKMFPDAFLPKTREYFRYEGSLTTPPCSEVVDWNVFGRTIAVANKDIEAFKAIFPMNSRPLQPLNRRFLLRGV